MSSTILRKVCNLSKNVSSRSKSIKVDSHLRGWDNRVGVHYSVRVLLSNLGNEEGSHARASATTKGVCELESLQTVA